MNKPTLLLIGAGGHAQACIDVVEQHGEFTIAGMIGTRDEVGSERYGYRVIASDDDLNDIIVDIPRVLIAVGQIKSPDLRIDFFARALALGYKFPRIISPHAYVSRAATIGAGSIVMHGAIVNAGACIGANCIINTHALIEHNVTVADHCHISTGAILNGAVRVGEGSFIGSSSTVKQGVSLGARCLVGMASCVRRNQADGARIVGGQ